MQLSDFAGYIATGIISLIVGILLDRWRSKPNVIWFLSPIHKFNISNNGNGNFPISTETLYIQNNGQAAAKNVKVVFLFKPPYKNVQPRTDYIESNTPDGHYMMTFSTLGAKEIMAVQVLYNDRVPQLLQVRSDNGISGNIPVWLTRRYPDWANYVFGIVIFVGFTAIALTFIRLGFLAWEKWLL